MDHQGILVVVSGFSGAGKGTLMKELLKRYDNYALSISATTRAPREGETDGKEYFFVTKEQFEKMRDELEKVEKDKLSEDEAVALKNKYATELKERFDELFKADTSGLFDVASPFTPLENGETWALVILKSVQKIVEKATGKSFEAMQSKASKYTEKYHAGPGKYPFPTK